MAKTDGKNTRPWGRVNAVIEPTRSAANPRLVHVGACWQTEAGNLKIKLEAEPTQWSDPHYPRVLLVIRDGAS